MAAGRYDLQLEQGATYTKRFVYQDATGTPMLLVGFSARMQIRSDYGSEDFLLELTDISGSTGITIDAEEGAIDIRIGADDTAAFEAPSDLTKLGVYDLELTELSDLSHVIRLVRGVVFVSPQVTRP